jgi:hypothetical protein
MSAEYDLSIQEHPPLMDDIMDSEVGILIGPVLRGHFNPTKSGVRGFFRSQE